MQEKAQEESEQEKEPTYVSQENRRRIMTMMMMMMMWLWCVWNSCVDVMDDQKSSKQHFKKTNENKWC